MASPSLTFLAVQHGILQGAGSPGLALHRALRWADAAAPVRLVFAPHLFLPKRGLGGRDLLRTGDVAAGHGHLSRTRLLKRMRETAGLEGFATAPHPGSPRGCPWRRRSHGAWVLPTTHAMMGTGLPSHVPPPLSHGDKLAGGNPAPGQRGGVTGEDFLGQRDHRCSHSKRGNVPHCPAPRRAPDTSHTSPRIQLGKDHRIIERFVSKGTFQGHLVPALSSEQGHLQPDQVAQNPIQPDLERL